jgi:hypothetical protein
MNLPLTGAWQLRRRDAAAGQEAMPGSSRFAGHRARLGWNWSVAVEANGIPIGWVIDGANRNDSLLLEPTLDAVAANGPLTDIETLHLDRGYDSHVTRLRVARAGIDDAVIQLRGTKVPGVKTQPVRLGLRWIVEATNSWWSNTANSAATPTADPATDTPRSASPPPSSSSADSSTTATAGAPSDRLSAQALSDRPTGRGQLGVPYSAWRSCVTRCTNSRRPHRVVRATSTF